MGKENPEKKNIKKRIKRTEIEIRYLKLLLFFFRDNTIKRERKLSKNKITGTITAICISFSDIPPQPPRSNNAFPT